MAALKPPLFPTSVVGSLPRPAHILDLMSKSDWDLADRQTLDEAVRSAIAMQEKAGLDVVTDGEWRRRSYIGVIAELSHGFTLETNPADGRPWTVVTEKLTPKEAGFIAYGPILPQLNKLDVQHLTMEFTAAGADDLESLGRLRKDFELGLGVVDVTPGVRQSAEVIAKRVERALERVDAERITLNPDCGFAPGSAAKVDMEEVCGKLCAQVDAARLLRARR